MTTIWVETSFVGFHRWLGAQGGRGYLAERHRHRFHVRVEVTVEHDDREIEFHDLGLEVENAIAALGARNAARIHDGIELGSKSCERMAGEIAASVAKVWPGRPMEVSVSEDGEFGATIRQQPESVGVIDEYRKEH